jgi:CPA2 family monovalent cation:H+ antiporter-2
LLPTSLQGHVIVAGYGSLGQLLGDRIRARGEPLLVLEEGEDRLELLHANGIEVLAGNASHDDVLEAAGLDRAKALFVTLPDAFESGEVIHVARRLNPGLRIVARADSAECMAHLQGQGADAVLQMEPELARVMIEQLAPA